MLTIQNSNLTIVPAKINKNKYYNNYNIGNSKDTISFKGMQVNKVNSSKEIKELVNLFYDALEHNLEPNSKKLGFISRIIKYISTLPILITTKLPGAVNEVVKSGNKIVGGFSLNIDKTGNTAHLGFLTITPDVVKTKTGVEALKLMGKRICSTLDSNKINEMTCTTNSRNKPINNLLKKLKADKIKELPFGENEYIISLDRLKTICQTV